MLLVLLVALVAFCAGGWVFSRIALRYPGGGEVADLYRPDGESVGIFDAIPQADREEAEKIAQQGLVEDITLPEDRVVVRESLERLPDRGVTVTNTEEIAAVARKEVQQEEIIAGAKKTFPGVEMDLSGTETAGVRVPVQAVELPDMRESKITMIKVPVRSFVVKNVEQYKEFKRRALGEYPAVNFSKEMLLVLESENNFPDKVFELISAEEKDGKVTAVYRVNVLGLDKKLNSHTVLVLPKTDAEIELKQVL